MRHPCHQPEHDGLDDREDRRSGAREPHRRAPRSSPSIPIDGPPSIEGYFDEVFAIPGMIGEMQKHSSASAYVIACFDDTGLDAARCIGDMPVVGIGEAAFHMASLVAGKFSVVTTLVALGAGDRAQSGALRACRPLRQGAGIATSPVLELEVPGSNARGKISEEIKRAISDDRAEAIVLGCAGMADLADELSREHGLPVLDGVACAVRLAEGCRRHSASGHRRSAAMQRPGARVFQELFARFSPEESGR